MERTTSTSRSQSPDPDPRAQSPEDKDSLKKKKMNTCNERKQPEKVTVKSANKDHSKNKISKAKGTTLSKHTIKIYITVEKGLKVGRKMKVPHTEDKKCASKRRLGPFNL